MLSLSFNKHIYLALLVFVFFLAASCQNKKSEEQQSATIINNDIPIYDFNTLEPFLYADTEKIYIVNFWAMWCIPCVKELPHLQQYVDNHPDVELLLVSLDFAEDIDTKLKPFLKKKNITSKVILLDDPDANSWIDKVNPEWSGSIPFTIIFNNKKRVFYERPFEDLKDLENEININFNN